MQNVSLRNGDRYILRDISWTVKKGEHWAVIGLNGSGKTTLLNIVNGYLWPSEGEVSVLGREFGKYDIRELRKEIGWISSSLQEKFYAGETAEEIVLSGRSATIGLYEKPKAKDIENANRLLKKFKCSPIAQQPYGTLSQGEKQKVLIARALAGSPRLLVMDEPCEGLDVIAREKILSLIERMSEGASAPTLVYVSHRIEEILPVFTHTLLLQRGRIHSQGRTREVLTGNNLSDFFEKPVDIRWQGNRAWLHL